MSRMTGKPFPLGSPCQVTRRITETGNGGGLPCPHCQILLRESRTGCSIQGAAECGCQVAGNHSNGCLRRKQQQRGQDGAYLDVARARPLSPGAAGGTPPPVPARQLRSKAQGSSATPPSASCMVCCCTCTTLPPFTEHPIPLPPTQPLPPLQTPLCTTRAAPKHAGGRSIAQKK